MPYITPEEREHIDKKILPSSILKQLGTKGQYNYAITKIIHHFVISKGKLKYKHLNDAMGILECAKQEFYRTAVAPYEDIKKNLNGSISELDKE